MITLTTEQAQQIEEVLSGMLNGTDWNNGTHSKMYRPKLPEVLATIRAARAQAKCAAPVRTKDLTDDEIEDVCCRLWSGGWRKKAMNDFARAVIEKFKEKNK